MNSHLSTAVHTWKTHRIWATCLGDPGPLADAHDVGRDPPCGGLQNDKCPRRRRSENLSWLLSHACVGPLALSRGRACGGAPCFLSFSRKSLGSTAPTCGRAKKNFKKTATQGREGGTARRHHTGILRRGKRKTENRQPKGGMGEDDGTPPPHRDFKERCVMR